MVPSVDTSVLAALVSTVADVDLRCFVVTSCVEIALCEAVTGWILAVVTGFTVDASCAGVVTELNRGFFVVVFGAEVGIFGRVVCCFIAVVTDFTVDMILVGVLVGRSVNVDGVFTNFLVTCGVVAVLAVAALCVGVPSLVAEVTTEFDTDALVVTF